MGAVVTFPNFEKYGGVKRSRMIKSGVGVDFPKPGISYPAALALLWPSKLSASGILKSAKGPAPVFTDTPTLSAGGVVPGDGPAFSSVVSWSDGGTRVWEITMTTASADLVGDVEVGGGLYVNSSGLKFSDGTNTATVAYDWDAGDVVTVVCQCDGDVMRVGVV